MRPRDLSDQAEHQGHRVLGNRVRRVCRYADDSHAGIGCGFEVHMVVSGTAQRKQPHASRSQNLYYFAIDAVVNKYTHDREAIGQPRGFGPQVCFEKSQLVLAANTIKIGPVIAARAEYRNFHVECPVG